MELHHLRRSEDRGFADHGWLKSRHSFSFANYYDPKHMGFGLLRVINEDRIEGGQGFDTHPHRDMEIISYVIDGALQHQDSIGNKTIIKPGEVQRMSAGTGVQHSEYNDLKDQVTHFLQIWILPEKLGIKPGYDQKSFSDVFSTSKDLVLVASKTGREGSVSLNQNVDLYAVNSKLSGQNRFQAKSDKHYWVQVIRGEVRINSETLQSGDGLGIEGVDELSLSWAKDSEFLFFDMP